MKSKNKAAVTLGALGGKARARNLSKAKLQEIAALGGKAARGKPRQRKTQPEARR